MKATDVLREEIVRTTYSEADELGNKSGRQLCRWCNHAPHTVDCETAALEQALDFADACEAMFAAYEAFHYYCERTARRDASDNHIPDDESMRLWRAYWDAEVKAKSLRPVESDARLPSGDRHPSPRDETWVRKFNEERAS